MGCSNPHPHGQVWSSSAVPTIPAQELRSLKEYALTKKASEDAPRGPEGKPTMEKWTWISNFQSLSGKACLLCEYAQAEIRAPKDAGRVVVSNDHWVALVPWWATWPFEILRKPRIPLNPYGILISLFSHCSPTILPTHWIHKRPFGGRESRLRWYAFSRNQALRQSVFVFICVFYGNTSATCPCEGWGVRRCES